MSTQFSVEVTITNGVASYKSTENGVESDGTITIAANEDAVITFVPAGGQTWFFESPWVTIDPTGGDISLSSGDASAVVIDDKNSDDTGSYTYCLQTTEGALDPRIINT
jgi:hypothetical protein